MSRQATEAFMDRLGAEADFRRAVGQGLQGRTDTAAATVEIAREAGFDFTEDEFDQVLLERYANRELGDAELEQAAGGGVTVGASFLSVVHKTSSGVTIAFPDVCKTPTLGDPSPIPYPNIGTTSDTKKTKG